MVRSRLVCNGRKRIMRTVAVFLLLLGVSMASESAVKKEPFGKTADGTPVEIYTLTSGAIEARITTYGGIVVSLKTPDRSGKPADIVLGYDTLDGYLSGNKAFMGAIIGRYAN